MIIDGCGLLFRAYYAVPQMLSQDNMPIGAIYGFIQSLRFLLNRLIPKRSNIDTMLAVALDVGKKENFRYSIYSEYKSNRSAVPQDLISQLQLARPLLNAFGIPCVSDPTCEADDVIAAYAKDAVNKDYEVVIVSSDKDLMQLISDQITFFDVTKKRFCSADDVYEKFLVGPHQICDYLAIVGDRADNIPGIHGIGKKIASELLKRFETLEGIYANLHKINETRIKNMLENGYEYAMLSKRLVMLKDEIHLQQAVCDMKWNGFSQHAKTISEFLSQYSLESLMGFLK